MQNIFLLIWTILSLSLSSAGLGNNNKAFVQKQSLFVTREIMKLGAVLQADSERFQTSMPAAKFATADCSTKNELPLVETELTVNKYFPNWFLY